VKKKEKEEIEGEKEKEKEEREEEEKKWRSEWRKGRRNIDWWRIDGRLKRGKLSTMCVEEREREKEREREREKKRKWERV
jgi:hypothetical protein